MRFFSIFSILLLFFVVAVAATGAGADIVFLSDGRRIEGKARRQGDQIIVRTSDGRTVTLAERDVLYVSRGAVRSPSSRPTPQTQPKSKSQSELKTSHAAAFRLSDLSRPESIIFFLMRRRPAGGGPGGAKLEEKIRHFRVLAHDRRRQVRGEWFRPGDFVRRRDAFEEVLREAEQNFRQARAGGKDNRPQSLEQKRRLAAGRVKLRQAAGLWADPLLRDFLLGEAAYQCKDFGQAEDFFRKCVADAPCVAAFRQGRARALMKLKRHGEALESYMAVLMLQPNSRDATGMLQEALADSPGAMIGTAVYKAAKKLLARRPPARRAGPRRTTRTGTVWLLCGKKLRSKVDSLPTPPMDRLVFRQAVGVPVGGSALLVDARAVRNAVELYVRIDEKTLVPASARRTASRGGRKHPPLTLVRVSGYEFTAAGLPEENELQAALGGTVYGLNMLVEMGRKVRTFPVSAKGISQDGRVMLSAGLAPGESAGPILAGDGKLVGFLGGKTNPQADDRSDRLYTASQIAPLLKRIGGSSTDTTTPITGKTFTVYAIGVERFEKKK